MGLSKKKVEESGEKKDLKANYTTEDHKTDLDVLLSNLNTHPTQVGFRCRCQRGAAHTRSPPKARNIREKI